VIDRDPVLVDEPVEILDVVRIRRIGQFEELGPMGFRELPVLPAERHVTHVSNLRTMENQSLNLQ
jgi:hypothetical protein